MGLTSKLDWTFQMNVAAICVALVFIGAIVVGVF